MKPAHKIALATVPRYCKPATFVEDSRLFTGATKPPSLSTIRNWIKEGRIKTALLAGRKFIDLHATLRAFGAAY